MGVWVPAASERKKVGSSGLVTAMVEDSPPSVWTGDHWVEYWATATRRVPPWRSSARSCGLMSTAVSLGVSAELGRARASEPGPLPGPQEHSVSESETAVRPASRAVRRYRGRPMVVLPGRMRRTRDVTSC